MHKIDLFVVKAKKVIWPRCQGAVESKLSFVMPQGFRSIEWGHLLAMGDLGVWLHRGGQGALCYLCLRPVEAAHQSIRPTATLPNPSSWQTCWWFTHCADMVSTTDKQYRNSSSFFSLYNGHQINWTACLAPSWSLRDQSVLLTFYESEVERNNLNNPFGVLKDLVQKYQKWVLSFPENVIQTDGCLVADTCKAKRKLFLNEKV